MLFVLPPRLNIDLILTGTGLGANLLNYKNNQVVISCTLLSSSSFIGAGTSRQRGRCSWAKGSSFMFIWLTGRFTSWGGGDGLCTALSLTSKNIESLYEVDGWAFIDDYSQCYGFFAAVPLRYRELLQMIINLPAQFPDRRSSHLKSDATEKINK